MIKSAVLHLRVNVALAETNVHHTIHVITELGDVIGGKGVDELLREVGQCTINYFTIGNADLI